MQTQRGGEAKLTPGSSLSSECSTLRRLEPPAVLLLKQNGPPPLLQTSWTSMLCPCNTLTPSWAVTWLMWVSVSWGWSGQPQPCVTHCFQRAAGCRRPQALRPAVTSLLRWRYSQERSLKSKKDKKSRQRGWVNQAIHGGHGAAAHLSRGMDWGLGYSPDHKWLD